MGYTSAYLKDVMNWTRPAETMTYVCFLVAFSTLDFLSSRPLLLVPIALHVYISVAHRKREDGSFLATFIKRGSMSSARINASLRIAVIRATGLFVSHSMPPSPIACISLSHPSKYVFLFPQLNAIPGLILLLLTFRLCSVELVRVGQTTPPPLPTTDPVWTQQKLWPKVFYYYSCLKYLLRPFYSPSVLLIVFVMTTTLLKFKCFHGTSLVTWNLLGGRLQSVVAGFITTVGKKVEDAYLTIIVHSARLRRQDQLEAARCRIHSDVPTASNMAVASTKVKSECVWHEQLVLNVRPNEPIVVTVVEGIFEHVVGECRVADTGNGRRLLWLLDPKGSLVGEIDLTFEWLGTREDPTPLDEIASDIHQREPCFDDVDEDRVIQVAKKTVQEIQRVNIESWSHVADTVYVDLYDRSLTGRFLGR